MIRLWKDPFVHFVVLGILLFATQNIWSPSSPDNDRIVISETAQQRLFGLWTIEALREPTEQDKQDIIADYVREEALVREAQAYGLADGDTVVRRRLAQKMRELIEDRVDITAPDDGTLKEWFAQNSANFDAPQLRTFQHIYFAGDAPQSNAAKIAAKITNAQKALKDGRDWQSLGDAFIEKRVYSDIAMGEAAQIFGRDFAEKIFTLPQGQWSEPVRSAFGQHLVRIAAIDKGSAADFSKQKPQILAAWQEAQRRNANRAAIDDVIARYSVDVE